jgi:hypothetical protein
MISRTTERFRQALARLPQQVRRQARQTYALFAQDPSHPSLHFRQVHPTAPIYSVRIGLNYRALGTRSGDTVIWFWIGSHADYDNLLNQF